MMSTRSDGKRKASSLSSSSALSSKRSANDDHANGAIRRIRLHNFLTFDDVEIFPAPGLNVVLGPNGTGKSSIVCAICLGLAGNTSLLGRAKEIKHFVKHGKRCGSVELELQGEKRNIIIKRNISAENNTSEWKLNGVVVREKDVSKVVKDFNIQLGNQCQFLPQDMVVKFAAMNPKELLEATEKAIGGEKMFQSHQELIVKQKQMIGKESSLRQHESQFEDLKRKNEMIQGEVDRFKNREVYLKDIEVIKKKKCWLEYTSARSKYVDCKNGRKKKDKELLNLRKELAPYEAEKAAKEQLVRNHRENMTVKQREKQKIQNKIDNLKQKLSEAEEKLELPLKDYEEKKKEEENRMQKIEKLTRELDGFTNELESLQDDIVQSQDECLECNEKLKEINAKLASLKPGIQKYIDDVATMEYEKEVIEKNLKRRSEEVDKRMHLLQQRSRDTYEAIMWLRKNQHLFSEPIIEPIVMVTNCASGEMLPQVESVVRGRDAFSFVALSKEDLHIFMTEMHEKRRLRVSGVIAPNRQLSSFRPEISMEKLKRHGFKAMLLDHIDAPRPVLQYLCSKFAIHNIPVAGDLSDAELERFEKNLPQDLKGLRYFTRTSDFTLQKSKFANHYISRSKEIRPPEFLIHSENKTEIATLQNELQEKDREMITCQEKLQKLRDNEKQLRVEDHEIRKVKNTFLQKKHRKRVLAGSIEANQAKLSQLQNGSIDLEEEKRFCKAEMIKINRKRVELVWNLSGIMSEFVALCEDLALAVTRHSHSQLQKENLSRQCQETEDKLKQMEATCRELKEREERLKGEAHRLLKEAESKTGVKDPALLSQELREKFDTFPSDLTELEDLIQTLQVKADLCAGGDPQIIEQYKDREKIIDRLANQIVEEKAILEAEKQKVDEIKQSWLQPLKELIGAVNDKFSFFFSEMDCAGEVNLHEDDQDFGQCGIEIRVKFRGSESFQILTSHRQSGGERSVSTMLYLLALQDLTKCPFRAVDEINQGMDPVNERKVFNLIVESVSGRSTAQYFLFTPKLLHTLKFSAHVTVLSIMNGPELWPDTSQNFNSLIDLVLGNQN